MTIKDDNVSKCIRQVENWSIAKDYHKIDNAKFDAEKVREELHIISPKMKKLLENISALDDFDMERYGTKFKHMIFSDLKSIGGAKAIGSALIANNYKLIYDNKLNIIDVGKSDKKFAIMCSTKIFDKDVGVRFRRKVFDMFNKRPDNVHGENIRFMVLDYGFKEGVDLFDIKYIHIMETPITRADKQQIIGRGTRLCGQKMLNFDRALGWRLNVYIYNTLLDKETPLFNLFLKYSNIDITKDVFTKELERVCIQSAVDFSLNNNVHIFKKPLDSEIVLLSEEVKLINAGIPEKTRVFDVVYGQRLEKNAKIDCRKGCRENVQLISTDLLLLAWYTRMPRLYDNDYIKQVQPRPVLCMNLIDDRMYCEHLQNIWKNTEEYIIQNETMLRNRINSLSKRDIIIANQINKLNKYIDTVTKTTTIETTLTPTSQMNYTQQYQFMNKNYNHLKWPPLTMENECIDNPAKNDKTMTFTPSQKFLQSYFTPESWYKGILVWHSTGTGKTCSGISMASNTFEKNGYTIIWVTRNALRGDIWKNMFKESCSLTSREPFVLEEALKNPKRYMGNNWLEPITYRQFSNLLSGKNALYEEMVKRNGEEDPLKKTLIVIDEAHKLLSSDLIPQEKPDFNIIHNKIQESYEKSKKNSVKVILMSATPYTDDPMHLIKLLNLIRRPSDQLPDNYDDFLKKYLTTDGTFKNKEQFMSVLSGYISYLNRNGDVRQFSQPIITNVDVPISKNSELGLDDKKNEYEQIVKHVKELESKKAGLVEKAKERKNQHKEVLAGIKKKADKTELSNRFKEEEEAIKKQQIEPIDKSITDEKQKMKALQTQIKSIKEATEQDYSQERILKDKCLADLKEKQ